MDNLDDLIDYGSVEGGSETDYAGGGEVKLPKPAFTYFDGKHEYNQNRVQKNSCTVHGAVGVVSDLCNVQYTEDEILALWNQAVKLGADPNMGWSMSEAVNLVRKDWNSKHDKQLVTLRYDFASPDWFAALDLGYSAVVGFRGSAGWQRDDFDGRLDGTEFPNTTYGHITRMTKIDDSDEYMIDNYTGQTAPNQYRIKRENLAKIRNFFGSSYIFVVKDALDQANKEVVIPTWAEVAAKKAETKGIITEGWDNPNQPMSVERIEWTLYKLGLRTNMRGEISQAEWAVILDRLNLLNQ